MWKPVTKVRYNRLEQDGDLRTDGVTTIEEKEIANSSMHKNNNIK